MARPKNPQRKDELLEQIVEYLLDKPLAGLSFRTLAAGLGISAYSLVYHFGDRRQLVHEIVSRIEARADRHKDEDVTTWTRADYDAWLHRVWTWVVHDRTRQLDRLGFEAAMQDLVEEHPAGTAGRNFAHWITRTNIWLTAQGVDPQDAAADARLLVASFYGLAYDHVINNDTDAATEAFEVMVRDFWNRLDRHLNQCRPRAEPQTPGTGSFQHR
jgi:AcrR family transcriptional regulator